jgi:hypothetical protein
MAQYPRRCEKTESPIPCQRGENVKLALRLLIFVWVWSIFLFSIVAMTMIYRKIAEIDSRMSQSSYFDSQRTTPDDSSSSCGIGRSRRRWPRWLGTTAPEENPPRLLDWLQDQFATQTFLYCLVIFTHFFRTIQTRMVQRNVGAANPVYVSVSIRMAVRSPLQGFWSFFMQQAQEQQNRQAHEGVAAHATHMVANRGAALFNAVSVKPDEEDNEEDLTIFYDVDDTAEDEDEDGDCFLHNDKNRDSNKGRRNGRG